MGGHLRFTPTTCVVALLFCGCSTAGTDKGLTNSSGTAGGGMSAGGGMPGANGGSTSGASFLGGMSGVGGTSGASGSQGTAATSGATGAAGMPSSGGSSGAGGSSANGGQAGTGGGGVAGSAGGGQSAGSAGDVGPGGGMGAGGNAGAGGASFVQPPLVTSADGAYWTTTGTLTEVTTGTADVTVDDATTAQTWQGFGGSFNEMGWTYLLMLSEADRNAALELLFGRDGCNLTLGRIPMGASDYATDRYSLDEVASGQTDPTMTSFSITRDQEKLIPFVQAAQAVKADIHFWASPWSPPTWMKDGPFNDDSAFDGGSMKSDDTTLGALALYFVKFVQGYQAVGIGIETVSPQNEPGYSGTYPTCAWAPATYATFVGEHLAPALSAASLSTKIMLGTFNAGTGDTSIVSTVMGDSTAKQKISVLGYQWGMQGNVKGDQKYGLPIWQTEHKCGNYPWETPFNDQVAPNDHAYAVESWGLLRDWIKAGVTAYSVWNMVLDTVGNGIDSSRVWPQNALLTVDTTEKKLNITPTYYVYRHFAQFVEPGAVMVATTGGDAIAFKNPDGHIVTIMYNSSAEKAYVVAVGGKKVQFTMPASGWATVTQ